MCKNPYKYVGPLDPAVDTSICVPRKSYVDRVIEGIIRDSYWAILGPRQTGKTTLLRQIENEFKNALYIHIDFDISPGKEENFYDWVVDKIIEEVPPADNLSPGFSKKLKNYSLQSKFYEFLKAFNPREEKKKIIFLFDHIENCRFLRNFLTIWRTVFHERFRKKELYKYSVILTSSKDIFELTVGPNSPFNIAEPLQLKDFSWEETVALIDAPFKELNIHIKPLAKEKLFAQVSGHPQLLQHACSLLVDRALKENRSLEEADINWVIDSLFKSNSTFRMLEEDIRGDRELKKLIEELLKQNRRVFHRYKKFSIAGAGAIDEEDSYCKIRNQAFEKFIKNILSSSSDRYRILGECGRGARGVVYRAEDSELGRTVALKILDKNLIKEARILAKLYHPNIVVIHDVGRLNDDHFISMEYIDGQNFSQFLHSGRVFTFAQIIYVAKILLKALHYSHKKNIIHRDIKPQNIMVNREGDIKILDFGVAIIRDQPVTGNNDTIIGTPFYISPEQIRREKVDQCSDIYSLGATLFHLITGQVPFDAESVMKIFAMHLNEPLPSIIKLRPDTPPRLVQIVERCMNKKKGERYQDTEEVLEQLRKVKTEAVDKTQIKKEIAAMITIDNAQTLTEMGGADTRLPPDYDTE